MSVKRDAIGPSSAGAAAAAATSLTFAHAIAADATNRLLTVGVAIGRNPDSVTLGVTYNLVAMTSQAKVHTNNGTIGFVEMFSLKAPATGSNNVVITVTGGTADIESGGVSFKGVDQTTPVSNVTTAFGNSTAPTVTVTSALKSMVVDALANGSSITSSSNMNQWIRNQNATTGGGNGAQSMEAGKASVVMTYLVGSDFWGIIGMTVAWDNVEDVITVPMWPAPCAGAFA